MSSRTMTRQIRKVQDSEISQASLDNAMRAMLDEEFDPDRLILISRVVDHARAGFVFPHDAALCEPLTDADLIRPGQLIAFQVKKTGAMVHIRRVTRVSSDDTIIFTSAYSDSGITEREYRRCDLKNLAIVHYRAVPVSKE